VWGVTSPPLYPPLVTYNILIIFMLRSYTKIIEFFTRFPYLFYYEFQSSYLYRPMLVRHRLILQLDFNAAKGIYVTDAIDFWKAVHKYSSRKFCKSLKLLTKLFKIGMKIEL
jgi:hypothetical protein